MDIILVGFILNASYAIILVAMLITLAFKIAEKDKRVRKTLTEIEARLSLRLQKLLYHNATIRSLLHDIRIHTRPRKRDAASNQTVQLDAETGNDVQRREGVETAVSHDVEASTDHNNEQSSSAEVWNYMPAITGKSDASKLPDASQESKQNCHLVGPDRLNVTTKSPSTSTQPDCRPKRTRPPKPAPKPGPVTQTKRQQPSATETKILNIATEYGCLSTRKTTQGGIDNKSFSSECVYVNISDMHEQRRGPLSAGDEMGREEREAPTSMYDVLDDQRQSCIDNTMF